MLYNEVRLGVESSIPLLGALEGTGHQEGASFLLFLREDAQTDPTPFGPIHLDPGPPVATVGEMRPGYITVGIGIDHSAPVGNVATEMHGGINLLSQLHYYRNVDRGDLGIGFSTGVIGLSSNDGMEFDYDIVSIPLGVNMRYMTVSASRFYWTVDLTFGAMINMVRFKSGSEDRLTTSKPFFAPTLSIGRHFFDRWRLAAYGSYLMILFDNNFFTGITTGLRLEYSF